MDCDSLLGASCTAVASASASWSFFAASAICVASASGMPPVCDWVVLWFVLLPFAAATAPAVAEFDCETAPSLPGLRTRIELALFVGPD